MSHSRFFGVALSAALLLPILGGVVFAGPHDRDKTPPAQSEDAKKPGKNCKSDKSGKASFRDCIGTDAHGDKTPGRKASTH